VSGEVLPKVSWVQALDREHVIGCGIYSQQQGGARAAMASTPSAPPAEPAAQRAQGLRRSRT